MVNDMIMVGISWLMIGISGLLLLIMVSASKIHAVISITDF